MPKHSITTHLPIWLLQAPVCAIVKGSGIGTKMNERNVGTDERYWPGKCHR